MLTSEKAPVSHPPQPRQLALVPDSPCQGLCATSAWTTKTTQLNQADPAFLKAHFYTSPAIFTFIKPHIYQYLRLGTTTGNKTEVLGFLLQILPVDNQQCLSLFRCISYIYIYMCVYTQLWFICNHGNLMERKQL